MINADIILDKRRKAKNGYPVKIRIYDNNAAKGNLKSRHYIKLNIYQDKEQLHLTSNLKRRELDLSEQVKYCNDNFLSLLESIEVISNGIPIDNIDIEIQVLEKRLELLKKQKSSIREIGLIEFGNTLIAERKVMGKPTRSHELTLKRVLQFITSEDIPLNSITKEWINNFDLYGKGRGLKDTSIYTYISLIKAIYKEAQTRESLNIKPENPFLRLRVFKKEKKASELSIQDLKHLLTVEESDVKKGDKLKTVSIAGLLLFQFAIGGHDLIDMSVLEWTNIKNNRIKFKRFKNRYKPTEGEEEDNKLNDFAIEFIKTYGDKNSKRIFSFIPDPRIDDDLYRKYQVSLNTNTYLKLARIIKTENKITTKSTRYLFRTLAGNLLINDFVIMKLQGHAPKGVTFGYQGALNYEVQDREHQKILDLVFK